MWDNGIETDSPIVASLVRVRSLLGSLFAWDPVEPPIPGSMERSLTERLSADDRQADRAPDDRRRDTAAGERVRLVYRFAEEALLEVSNATAFALWHVGWVDLANGKKTAEMAVYLKSRGVGTRSYMALIQPFRHLFVYPAYTARIARLWAERMAGDRRGRLADQPSSGRRA